MTQPAALSMGRRLVEVLAISLAGGLLLHVFTRFPLGVFVGLGYTLLMAPAVVERWKAPLLGFIPGFILFCFIAHQPLGKFGWFVPYLLPALLMWSYCLQGLFAGALRRFTTLPAWVMVPVATGAAEWTRRLLDPGGYSMYKVGTGLVQWPILVQIVDVVGVFVLSMLAMVVWSVPLELLRWRLDPGGPASRKSVLRGAALAGVILILLPAYGAWRMASLEFSEGPRVAVIQPSLDHTRDATPAVVDAQQRMTANWIPPGSADLVVWPENAILAVYEEEPKYQEIVSWLARSRGAPMLIGVQGWDPTHTRPTNTSLIVGQDGAIAARYDKVMLFPFTERRVFPALEQIWPWLYNRFVHLTLVAWRDAPNGWAPEEAETMTVILGGQEMKIWTPICYEIFFPRLGRQARSHDASFFVNLTSEGWLGWPASRDMIAAAILRAVENRVGLVRAANTGVTAFIGPDGRADAVLRGRKGRMHLDEGHLTHRVRLCNAGPTIYSRLGSLIDPLPFTAWLVLLIGGLVRSWRSRTRSHS